MILSIKDDSGNWLMDKNAITNNITSFFHNLFTSASALAEMNDVLNYIDVKISEEINNSLLLPISREEVKSAAFNLGKSKAPGPDGFSSMFYHAA